MMSFDCWYFPHVLIIAKIILKTIFAAIYGILTTFVKKELTSYHCKSHWEVVPVFSSVAKH